MKFIPWLFLLLSKATAAMGESVVPPPRIDPLSDRILFLILLWVAISALLIVLSWQISHADTLFRMMSKDPPKGDVRKESIGKGSNPPDPTT